MKTILVAVDFSAISTEVMDAATALAKDTGAQITLLTVIQPPVITSEYAPFIENMAEITAAAEKSATRRMGELKARLAAEQIKAEIVQLVGPPVPHIIEEAKRRAVDYIVMGSHGHTAIYDLLVGSTTHGVMLRAPCPVVVVPTKKRPAVA